MIYHVQATINNYTNSSIFIKDVYHANLFCVAILVCLQQYFTILGSTFDQEILQNILKDTPPTDIYILIQTSG